MKDLVKIIVIWQPKVILVAKGVQRWKLTKAWVYCCLGSVSFHTHNLGCAIAVLFVSFKSKLHAWRTLCYARGLKARSVFRKHQVTQEKTAFFLNNAIGVRQNVGCSLDAQEAHRLESQCALTIQPGQKICNYLP